jgi:carbonic anhydrase/acetyltransferase-like protein (isoleucine patch superfamily)
MPLYTLDGKSPTFVDEASTWVAPDASVIGDITIGRDVGIWFGAALRGDTEPITIGDGTNVQSIRSCIPIPVFR